MIIVITVSGNGFLSILHESITWINDNSFLITPSETNFSDMFGNVQ